MDISKILVESLFLLPSLRHDAERLNINGLDGWISPLTPHSANRCRFVGGAEEIELVEKCIQFFNQRGCGLTWVIGGEQYREGTYNILKSAGFAEGRFSLLDGMVLDLNHLDLFATGPTNIVEISNEETKKNISTIARAYSYESHKVAEFFWTTSIKNPEIDVRVYCVHDKENGRPIGYAKSTFMHKFGVVIMHGGCIVPEERGKGLYRKLTEYRLLDARRHNASMALVQSDSKSSSYLYRTIGFRKICDIHFLEWLAPS